MSTVNNYYNALMNSKPPYGDSGFVSNDPSVNESSHVPRSAPKDIKHDPQSLIFQFHDYCCRSIDSPPSPRENPQSIPEKVTCGIAFPSHYTRGFQDGGIEFCIPGVTQGIFTPYEDVNVHFKLEEEDVEQSSLNCFVDAAKTLLDWQLRNRERAQIYDQTEFDSETQEQRRPGMWDRRQDQHQANDIRLYYNYFSGLDPNNGDKDREIAKRNSF